MATMTQLTGAPIEMEISKVKFQACTLSDKDNCELDEFVRTKIIRTAMESMREMDLSRSERSELMSSSVKAAAGVRWGDKDGAPIMAAIEGQIRIGYQMVKNQHEITFDKFEGIARAEKIEDRREREDQVLSNLEEISRVYWQLNADFDDDEKEEDTPDTGEDLDPNL